MRIAYLTGEYPRATDTFIQREVATLREHGVEVHTFSVRRTGSEHLVGPEQKQERDRTFYLLPPNPINLLLAHLGLLFSSPSRYLKAIKLAWATRQPGLQAGIYQLFYFLEAGILAGQIRKRQISHLHNHFPDSSGSVAMLAAELGGFSFSFTMHGPYIFLSRIVGVWMKKSSDRYLWLASATIAVVKEWFLHQQTSGIGCTSSIAGSTQLYLHLLTIKSQVTGCCLWEDSPPPKVYLSC